jgi:hypothetical protein
MERCGVISFFNKYARNAHSQNGEDGIIEEVLKRIGLTTGHAVEMGGNDGHWMSNTRYLLEHGWSGTFVEADYNLHLQSKANWAHNAKVKSICSRVSPDNIHAFVKYYCDLLSLDTDGLDYDLFKALQVKPSVVIVEIDSSYLPDVYAFNSDGAGTYRNTLELGISKGYFLLCHTGNLIFIDEKYRELFPEIEGDGLTNAELYFNRGWLKEEAA